GTLPRGRLRRRPRRPGHARLVDPDRRPSQVTDPHEPRPLFASPGRIVPPGSAQSAPRPAAAVPPPQQPGPMPTVVPPGARPRSPPPTDYREPRRPARRGMSAWWVVPLLVLSLLAGFAGSMAERALRDERPVSAD